MTSASSATRASRRRRIAVVIRSLRPEDGGAEHWTWQFVHWLARRDEVHCVVAAAPKDPPAGVRVHRVDRRLKGLRFAKAAGALALSLNADIIHDMGMGIVGDVFQPHHGSRDAVFAHNLLFATAWQRELKCRTRAWHPRYRALDRMTRLQFQDPEKRFVALSRRVAEHFRSLHQVPAEAIRVVPNGVDGKRFTPVNRARFRDTWRSRFEYREKELVLLHVGHNPRVKGLATIMQAAATLRNRGLPIRLLVVGRRRELSERWAKRWGIEPIVSCTGPLPDCVPAFAAADVCVQPSFYDPCSLVSLEALASGLPLITSRFNGVAEMMQDGLQGCCLHDPADAEELARAILRLQDRDARDRMGQAARDLALQHSLEHNFEQIADVYQDRLAERRAA